MDFRLNLDTERVAHIQMSGPLCLDPTLPVRDALRQMREHRSGAVLICQDEVLLGIFTERDALRLLASERPALDAPIGRLMTPNPVTLTVDDKIGHAIAKMSGGGYRHLPVVDEKGHPQGFLSVATILSYLVDLFPAVVYNLPPEPNRAVNEREGA